MQPTPDFKLLLEAETEVRRKNWRAIEEQRREQSAMQLQRIKERLERLTDAYLDNLIDKTVFEERRVALVATQKELSIDADQIRDPVTANDRFHEFLELASSLISSYEMAVGVDKRDFLRSVTSNRCAHQKNLAITLQKPFQVLAESSKTSRGGLSV